MAWYSILPSHLAVYEQWAVKTFIFLALLNLSPWLIAIVYDFVLYVFRTVAYEFPVWGGRARGDTPPRAPALGDKKRRMSLAEMITSGDSPFRRGSNEHPEIKMREKHTRTFSNDSIQEE